MACLKLIGQPIDPNYNSLLGRKPQAPEKHKGRSLQDLMRNEPSIRYDRRHWGGRLADAWLRAPHFHPRERFELDALDAIAILVDHGLGISLVLDWHGPWPEGLRLVKIPVPSDPIFHDVGFLWPRNSLRLRQIDALLAEARKAFPKTSTSENSKAERADVSQMPFRDILWTILL